MQRDQNLKDKKRKYSCFEEKWPREFNPVKIVKRWGRNVKHAYQRIMYGYCDRDVWSIDWWFLSVVPNMLQDLRETTHGFPQEVADMVGYDSNREDAEEKEVEAVKLWDSILEDMILSFREANEDTCQCKNPYDAEWHKACEEFEQKYGFWGEKLQTEEDILEEKKSGNHRMYLPHDVPKYKEISEKHLAASHELAEYQHKCKNKGMELFNKWFWDLWD